MQLLKFYLPQTAKHDGDLLSDWLLQQAHQFGIPGGSVFRAVAGYGRHGRLREEHFFELAGDLPVSVEFIAAEAALDALLQRLAAANIHIFYLRLPVESGVS